MYDEKYVLSGKGTYDGRKPQVWLLNVRNYLAGRHEELDHVLDWIEKQNGEIAKDPSGMSGLPAIDCAGYLDLSRQLWAFLGPLVAGDPSMESAFANVERHNGLEAWRRIAEPVNDDKALVLQDLLAPVTNHQRSSDHGWVRRGLEGVGDEYSSLHGGLRESPRGRRP